MDHLYSDYFLNLAQVAIGFVGFSTIAVVLREMMGEPLRCSGASRARHSAYSASSTRSTMCTGGAG